MAAGPRDDFSEATKRTLAARVANRCSNPGCRALTSGPQTDPTKAVNIGVAAHIMAASPGGPRYDPASTPEQRADPENGVWLCQNCAKLVDNDPAWYTTETLRSWKTNAEVEADNLIGKTASSTSEQVIDKWVDIDYVEKAGIAQRLRDEGYTLRWVDANNESRRVDLDGWEHVVIEQGDGNRARLKIHDSPVIGGYVVLLKKKKSPADR